jgi:hypothetical protein
LVRKKSASVTMDNLWMCIGTWSVGARRGNSHPGSVSALVGYDHRF